METGRISPNSVYHLTSTVSDEISFFAGVWGSRLGDLPKVCGQNQVVPAKVWSFGGQVFGVQSYHTFGWYWKLRESPSPKTNMTGWKKSPCSIGKYIDSFRAWSHFPSQSLVRFGGPYPLLPCLRCLGGLNVTPRYYQPNEGSKGLTYNKIPPGWTPAPGLAGQGSNCVFVGLATRKGKDIWGCGNTNTKMQRCFKNGGGL